MKQINITILFSVLTISSLLAQNKPKKIVKYVKNSKIRYEYYQQDGKPEGAYTYYYDNQKQVEGNLKNDYPDGEWNFFDERGKLSIKGNYKEGEEVGAWYYFINDTLKSKLLFDPEGKIDTLCGFWPDGTISHRRIVNKTKDLSNSVLFSKNSKIIEKYTLVSNKLHGKIERFNEQGEKTLEMVYNNGKPMDLIIKEKNDLFPDYFSGFLINGNGVLTIDLLDTLNGKYFRFQELTYLNGELNGTYKMYYPSGKVACEGQYKDGFLLGDFTFYDEAGKLEFVSYNFSDSLRIDYKRSVFSEYYEEYSNLGVRPTFLGGDLNQFRLYINNTLKYPLTSAENGVEGRLLVKFTVNTVGKVIEPKIVESVGTYLDAEVLRIIGLSPYWQPGFMYDLPIQVQFTFPIMFVIN